jgi:predicted aspartyl protease
MIFTFVAALFATEPIVVPFEELPSGHLVVPCTIEGHGPYRFVVDTGANAFVIDPEVAAELGFDLTKAPHKKVHAADGQAVAIPILVLRDVRLGARVLRRAPSIVTDVDALLGESGIVGILGRDMFVGDRLEVDFPRRELRVLDSFLDEDALPLTRLRGGLSAVEMADGLTVIIDLGADISVLNSPGALLLAAPAATPVAGVASGLTGPIETTSWVQLPPLDLGDPTPGGAVPVVDLGVFETLRLKDSPALLLGVDQMQGRVLAIDYGAKTISLRTADR